MAASVAPFACTMEFQKVMRTTPLWFASALRLQLGRLLAPAAGAPALATTVAVAVLAEVTNRAAAMSREKRVVRMCIA
jgi:hypothetical protein